MTAPDRLRDEKCGDTFLCAEHAPVQCGLSCPPDWPGHWRDWHREDHNCATKGRAVRSEKIRCQHCGCDYVDEYTRDTHEIVCGVGWQKERNALRERLAAAEKKLELKWLIEEQLGSALARAETAERERDEAFKAGMLRAAEIADALMTTADGKFDLRVLRARQGEKNLELAASCAAGMSHAAREIATAILAEAKGSGG